MEVSRQRRAARFPSGRSGCATACLALVLLPAAAAPAVAAESPAVAGAGSPFAATPEMRRHALRIAALPGGTRRKVEAIVDLIFGRHEGALAFTYRRQQTLTAAEAYARRQGNCLTLVNLFVALARAADIDAGFYEVEDYETFYRHGGLVVRSDHVVGGVALANGLITVDFLPGRAKRYRLLRRIGDRRAVAHYFKATATEAMLAGDLDRALELFGRALETDPRFAESWNNYALLLRRRGDDAGARAALEKARELGPELLPALENLAGLHRARGELAAAARLDERILELKTRNPFYLVELGSRKLAGGELEAAAELAERARRLRPDVPEVYLLLGRLELARGDQRRAERQFAQARRKSAAYSERFESAVQEKISRLLAAAEPPPSG